MLYKNEKNYDVFTQKLAVLFIYYICHPFEKMSKPTHGSEAKVKRSTKKKDTESKTILKVKYMWSDIC